ncbi:hypothetical protein D3C80_1215120 [compost metagenome]
MLQLLRPGQGGVIARGVGLGGLHRRLLLAQLGAQQDVVHLHQRLALAHIGAFIDIEGGGGQPAGLGAHGHLLPGRDGAGRHHGAGQGDRGRRRRADGLARGAALLLRRGVAVSAAGGQGQARRQGEGQGSGQPGRKASRNRHGDILGG